MTPALSHAMCCIVTGAESVKRALFTDGDVFRARYRRPLLLTGIDVGAIRPDPAARPLPAPPEPPLPLGRANSATLAAHPAEAWAPGALPAYRAGLDDLNDDVIEGD